MSFTHYNDSSCFEAILDKFGCIANDMTVAIFELVKREGYQIDSFSLEESVPPIILENEHSIR